MSRLNFDNHNVAMAPVPWDILPTCCGFLTVVDCLVETLPGVGLEHSSPCTRRPHRDAENQRNAQSNAANVEQRIRVLVVGIADSSSTSRSMKV